ncbi:uncharacterized protein LOC103360097 [Stegastes partitus]|uniref:Uncharacterized protein LOC103360097 n=1 Tax=Stegastes partitus TaxID=144197 RepID=A0A9Y4JWV9_9TELE|nr:PREDICTED: uncharacterized protein LOC103360097 [Stegastes partitus]
MDFLGFLVLMFCHLSQAFPAPVDTVIVQFQQWGVVGDQRFTGQVLLNGVSLSGTSQGVSSLIQTMSADALLPALLSVNKTSAMGNHTVLHSRECVLEGSQLHWVDRVFYDGKVYLTLDHNDMWTVHEPQALTLKVLLEQEMRRTKAERIHLQESCVKLMRELRLSEERSAPGVPLPQFLIPILALLAFTGLIVISLLISKRKGLRHPGGVVGSIIHYPKDMTAVTPERNSCGGYHTLVSAE